ncbi:MAG: TraB/GumN family protein [Candidatus Bathyarchaeia archaeon]
MIEIYDIDYNKHVEIIGTAHFTRRSLNDAYEAIKSLKPKDVALELDWGRFKLLNSNCLTCPRRRSCQTTCEFIGATEALGNVDANIWLIDMTEQQIRQRIRNRMTPLEVSRIGVPMFHYEYEDPIWLWERGFKERVINNSKRQIETQRRLFPSIWQVLIDERNALMASRLAWIATKNLKEGKNPMILTFVGAAHVEGIRDLLRNPPLIKENLRKFGLPFTEPTLIRRVAVQGD